MNMDKGRTGLIPKEQKIEKIAEKDIKEKQKNTVLDAVNRICRSCTCYGLDCAGTTDPVWTGCVYRRPDNRMEITVVKLQTANYTPADLMYSWAKENGAQFYRTKYGSARIRYKGKNWQYDHWEINKNEDETESITLYLEEERGRHEAERRNKEKESSMSVL